MSTRDDRKTLKQKALRAAKAVTMSAALMGATGCTDGDDQPTEPDDAWTVTDDDARTDTSADTSDTHVMPDVQPDTSQPTCTFTSDGVCPDTCTPDNDADCCRESNRGSCMVYDQQCVCAVPGPFVPPAML